MMLSCASPCTSTTNPSSCDSQPTSGICDTVPGTSSFHGKPGIGGGSAATHMHQQVPSIDSMFPSSSSPAVARSVPPNQEPQFPESTAKVAYLTTTMANQAALDYELEKFENIFEWIKKYKDSSNKENAPQLQSQVEQKPVMPLEEATHEKKAVKRMREDNEDEQADHAAPERKKSALDDEPDYKLEDIGSVAKAEPAPPTLQMEENPLKRMERLTSSSNFSQPSTLSEVIEVPKKDDRASKQDKEKEQMQAQHQMMEQQRAMYQQHQMAMMQAAHQAKCSPNPNQPQFSMQMGPNGPYPAAMHPGHPHHHQFMMQQHQARMMAAAQMGKGSPGSFPMVSPHPGMPMMAGHPAFRHGMPPMSQGGMPTPQQQQQMMAAQHHFMQMQRAGMPPHAMQGGPPFHPGHPMFGGHGMPSGPMQPSPMGPMGMSGGPGYPGAMPRAHSAAMASPSMGPSPMPRPPSSSVPAPQSVPTSQSMMSPFHGMIPPGGHHYHQMRQGPGSVGPGPSASANITPGAQMHPGPAFPQPMSGQMPPGMHTPSSGPGFLQPGGPGGPQMPMGHMGQHPGMLHTAPQLPSGPPMAGESFNQQYQWPQHFADPNAL